MQVHSENEIWKKKINELRDGVARTSGVCSSDARTISDLLSHYYSSSIRNQFELRDVFTLFLADAFVNLDVGVSLGTFNYLTDLMVKRTDMSFVPKNKSWNPYVYVETPAINSMPKDRADTYLFNAGFLRHYLERRRTHISREYLKTRGQEDYALCAEIVPNMEWRAIFTDLGERFSFFADGINHVLNIHVTPDIADVLVTNRYLDAVLSHEAESSTQT